MQKSTFVLLSIIGANLSPQKNRGRVASAPADSIAGFDAWLPVRDPRRRGVRVGHPDDDLVGELVPERKLYGARRVIKQCGQCDTDLIRAEHKWV